MPYIEQRFRANLDYLIDEMLRYSLHREGFLNYTLFKLCKELNKGKFESYSSYKSFIGELNECVAEIRRRLLAPYEDKKIDENGDI